jgi:hypothetical protein
MSSVYSTFSKSVLLPHIGFSIFKPVIFPLHYFPFVSPDNLFFTYSFFPLLPINHWSFLSPILPILSPIPSSYHQFHLFLTACILSSPVLSSPSHQSSLSLTSSVSLPLTCSILACSHLFHLSLLSPVPFILLSPVPS